jgi:hypothetical protein
MEEIFRALNQLLADGLVRNYAIGGAVGAACYIEAVRTEDVDAFVFLPEAVSPLLVSLSPIYAVLKAMGGIVEREYVRFGAWPLQILTDANDLIAEAIEQASTQDFAGIPVRVFRPEHLCAIALQTGRAKDYLRVTMFLEEQKVNEADLRRLADRFGLTTRLDRVMELDRED